LCLTYGETVTVGQEAPLAPQELHIVARQNWKKPGLVEFLIIVVHLRETAANLASKLVLPIAKVRDASGTSKERALSLSRHVV
jgi:hypothetical protein